MDTINSWWPQLHEEIRRWLVNNFWSPVAPFTRSEISRLGGPTEEGSFWDRRDGDVYLPNEAVMWIVKHPDFEHLNMPKAPDPRAAYFRRGWPRRQP